MIVFDLSAPHDQGFVLTGDRRLDLDEQLQELVSQSGSNEVTPEHYLLLITRYPDPVIESLLLRLGVSLADVGQRLAVREPLPPPRLSVTAPHGGRSKQVLSYAFNEAQFLRHRVVSDGHLLLGMLAHPSPAREALAAAGLERQAFQKAFGEAVGEVRIEDIASSCEDIVIATVTQVSDSGTTRYATAEAQESLKGTLAGAFRFQAFPTWTCDISDARRGETVLLFLIRDPKHGLVIAHSGRGRMPLHYFDSKRYATVRRSDVRLPKDASVLPGPDPQYEFRFVSVALPYLRDLIQAIQQPPPLA